MLILSIQILWVLYYIVVLQDATMGDNWVKGMWGSFISYNCMFIIIKNIFVLNRD